MNIFETADYMKYKQGILPSFENLIYSTYSTTAIFKKYIQPILMGKIDISMGFDTVYSRIRSKLDGSHNAKKGLFHEERLYLVNQIAKEGKLQSRGNLVDLGRKKRKYKFILPLRVRERCILLCKELYELNDVSREEFNKKLVELFSLIENSIGVQEITVTHDIDGLFQYDGKLYLIEAKNNFSTQNFIRCGNFEKFFETWACLVYYMVCEVNGRKLHIDSSLKPYFEVTSVSWNTLGLFCLIHKKVGDLKRRNCMPVVKTLKSGVGGIIDAWSFYSWFYGVDFDVLCKVEGAYHHNIDRAIEKAENYIRDTLKALKLMK